jgi:nucleoside-diphosphate-sugar epimerase
MRVQVAGGRGFIGAAVAAALRRAGVDVEVSGREPALVPAAHRPRRPIETLIWCAGGRGDLAAMTEAHVEAPLRAVRINPGLRSVVYLSSGEVYGSQAVPFRETAPRLGKGDYARSKISGENALAALCAERRLALTILRPAVVYGPGQAGTMLIPSAITHLCEGRPLALTAGEQTRDWVHVDDVAAAVAATVARHGAGIYNLGSGREVTVRAAMEPLAEAVGPHARALLRWGELPYRAEEQMRYALDADLAEEALRWRPRIGFAEGVAECVRAFRALVGASA